jgi:tetratricopeptide (TPR) repeat protein
MTIKPFFYILLLLVFLFQPESNSYATEVRLDKGIEEYRAENYEEALDTLLTVRYQQPASSMAAFYLGLTYKQLKDYRQAEIHLRDALDLSPPVIDAYVELAEALYTLDRTDESLRLIEKSEKEGIRTAYAAFLKGLVLLKKDRTGEAIKAFTRAKELDNSLEQPSDFQIAMAHIQAQRFEDAKKSLRAIEQIDPASDLASFAKEYEKALERTVGIYRPWQFRAGLAYQFDTNVILKPTTQIPGVSISGEEDSSIAGTFNASYAPLFKSPYFLRFYYNFYSNTYFNLNSYNLIAQNLSVVPGYNFSEAAFSMPLSYAYYLIDGRGYMGLLSIRPTLQFIVRPNHLVQVSAGYDKRELFDGPLHSDEDRDGHVFNASAGYIHTFKQGKGALSLAYEFSNEDTDGKNWANLGSRFLFSLLIPEPVRKTDFVLSGDFLLQHYKNTHSVFGVKRKDETFTISATLLAELVKGLNLNLQYSYIRADSNIAVYDYDRNIYTAGLEYRF